MKQLKKQYATMADYKNNDYTGKLFQFQLHKRNPDPSYTNSTGEKAYYTARRKIRLEDDILDLKTKTRRPIRYAKGVMTLFVDKHTEADLKKSTESALFLNGQFVLDDSDPLLLEFLMISNHNGSNPNRLTTKQILYNFKDTSSQLKDIMEKDDLEYEAVKWLKDRKDRFSEVYDYARVMIGERVPQMDTTEIKMQMRYLAKSNPKGFLEKLDDPKTKREMVILAAIGEDFLTVNAGTNSIAWKDNPSQPISTAPIGQDVVKYFVEASFSQEGDKVFAAIERYMKAAADRDNNIASPVDNNIVPSVEKSIAPPIVNNVEAPELPKIEAAPSFSSHAGDSAAILDECIDLEIIRKNKFWMYYSNEDGNWKGNGKKNFIGEMDGDKVLYDSLKKELAVRKNQ